MKQKFIIPIIVLSFFSLALYAQDDSSGDSKKFEVGDFSEIMLDGAFKVYLVQGDNCSVVVKSSNDEVFENIKVRRNQNEVEIKVDQSFFKYSAVNLYITFKTLEKLKIEGGVNLKTKGYLDLNDLEVNIEGGANIDLDMKAQNVEVYGEGGFLFDLNGVADKLDVTIKGAGHISASDLKTKEVNFKVEGFGTGSVYATKVLNAKIEGVGKIRYKGDPKVTQYIDGLGSVKPY